MISCKIGLVSLPKDSNMSILIIGEIFDKAVRNDINILYEIQKNLMHLCPFKINVKDQKLYPDIMEDIIVFQTKYNLTKKITSIEPLSDGIINYLSPQLYDIDCMVPLFEDTIPRNIYNVNDSTFVRLFIMLPCTNPIVRGEIINKCINICANTQIFFNVMGTKRTCDITQKHLLYSGIPANNIYVNKNYEYPDSIIEALTITDIFCEPNEIYLCSSSSEIHNLLDISRLIHKLKITDKKWRFISE